MSTLVNFKIVFLDPIAGWEEGGGEDKKDKTVPRGLKSVKRTYNGQTKLGGSLEVTGAI